jgi:TolB-like protein/Tfp pilus assembly protein PilF
MASPLDNLRVAFAGRLTIERLLAEGGMSRVYVAHDPGLNRPVALKLLREELAAGLAGDRFEREIHVAATLQHPQVVPLLSAGVLPDYFGPGRPAHWYTMPLVEGESLRARIARSGPLGVPDAVAILRDVGRALAFAKLPEERPHSAEAFLAELEHAAAKPAVPHFTTRRLVLGVAAGVVLLLLAIALLGRRSGPGRQVRLAVLPFEERGCPSDARLADGLSDELTARLVRVNGLNVVARASALGFRSSGKTAPEFGQDLGAEYVLDGSVACDASSGKVRVIPALVRVRDEAQTWGEPQEGNRADVFRLQADLAERVAVALQGRLVPADRAAVRRSTTASLGAYDAYVLGMSYFRQRGPALRQAVTYFNQAIALDSGYARAWAGLAMSYAVNPSWHMPGIDATNAADSAAHAAARALALDASLPEAHAAMGLVQFQRFQWPGAEASFRRAIARDPSFASAHSWLGEVLMIRGRAVEALASQHAALGLDPLSSQFTGLVGHAHMAMRNLDSAATYHRRAVAMDTGAMRAFWLSALAGVLWLKGDAMPSSWEDSRTTPEHQRLMRLALDSAHRDALGALADSLLHRRDYDITLVLVLPLLGRRQEGLRVLEEMALDPGRRSPLTAIFSHPYLFDPYRDLPEFTAFQRRFGLPP